MARTIDLAYRGQTVTCMIEKVDRSSLYGSVETETHDIDGRPCRLASLASDGRTLVPSGGTALAYMNAAGEWLERSDLTTVDGEGRRLNTVASSFSAPLELDMPSSPQRFLEHAIRLVYALDPVDGAAMPAALAETLAAGTILKTDFSYRGGASADPAFVLKGADGNVWLLVGEEKTIDFVGLSQTSGLAGEDEEDAAGGDDELDFDMM